MIGVSSMTRGYAARSGRGKVESAVAPTADIRRRKRPLPLSAKRGSRHQSSSETQYGSKKLRPSGSVAIWRRGLAHLSPCCHRDAVRARAVNGPLRQAGRFGFLDELAYICEPTAVPLRHRQRQQVGPIAVLQHPEAGLLGRILQKREAG